MFQWERRRGGDGNGGATVPGSGCNHLRGEHHTKPGREGRKNVSGLHPFNCVQVLQHFCLFGVCSLIFPSISIK